MAVLIDCGWQLDKTRKWLPSQLVIPVEDHFALFIVGAFFEKKGPNCNSIHFASISIGVVSHSSSSK